jgi:hypothetical protein
MEKVRGNFAGNFAKYLGKDGDAGERDIPGMLVGQGEPEGASPHEGLKVQVGVREGVYMHRIARKLRQKRADEAKHRQTSKALELVDAKHAPLFSRFQFLRMKQGHSELSAMLPMFGAAAKAKGLRWGMARSHGAAKYAGIHLISKNSPEIALRIMEYAVLATLITRQEKT